jgi:hypothetical protein
VVDEVTAPVVQAMLNRPGTDRCTGAEHQVGRLWSLQRALFRFQPGFIEINDWTDDLDTPEDLAYLPVIESAIRAEGQT